MGAFWFQDAQSAFVHVLLRIEWMELHRPVSHADGKGKVFVFSCILQDRKDIYFRIERVEGENPLCSLIERTGKQCSTACLILQGEVMTPHCPFEVLELGSE